MGRRFLRCGAVRWVVLWLSVGLVTFGFALSVAFSPPASAAPSAECLAHLARVGKTEAADQRYWLQRGQTPRKCPLRGESASSSEKRDDDKKSRYCRKRWFC